MFFISARLWAQRAEYDFYKEGRDKKPEAYADELRQAGTLEKEISRRLDLLRNHRTDLEADRWNRFYGNSASKYNREPNAFLTQVVEGIKPGVALDYAMGEGRNSLYLAKLGWTVYGFDISNTGVTIAKRHASELGLKIDAQVSSDASYDFGKDRFDLILFSWSMPLVDVRKVINALKPGGIVVMEFGPGFTGRNGMLQLFDELVIERYSLTHAVSDFSGRLETDIFRLIARKEPLKP